MKNFKFKVDGIENLTEIDQNIIYEAIEESNGIMRIEWEQEGEEPTFCYYDKSDVEDYIDDGKWTVL